MVCFLLNLKVKGIKNIINELFLETIKDCSNPHYKYTAISNGTEKILDVVSKENGIKIYDIDLIYEKI